MRWRVSEATDDPAWHQVLRRVPATDVFFSPEYHWVYEGHVSGTAYAFIAEDGDDLLLHPFFVRPIYGDRRRASRGAAVRHRDRARTRGPGGHHDRCRRPATRLGDLLTMVHGDRGGCRVHPVPHVFWTIGATGTRRAPSSATGIRLQLASCVARRPCGHPIPPCTAIWYARRSSTASTVEKAHGPKVCPPSRSCTKPRCAESEPPTTPTTPGRSSRLWLPGLVNP